MKAQMSKMALVGLCLLLLMSTINSLSQGQKLFTSMQQWQGLQPIWEQVKQAPELLQAHKISLENLHDDLSQQKSIINIEDPLALVSYLESQCQTKNLKITRLPEAANENQAGFQVQSTQFSLEGSFSDILSLIYQIEQKDQLGQLTQVQLETQYFRQNGQKKRFLLAHITLQKLRPA
ncbi:MAG: hypothetical protein AB8H47_05140 [Bacteroidia bacterium]